MEFLLLLPRSRCSQPCAALGLGRGGLGPLACWNQADGHGPCQGEWLTAGPGPETSWTHKVPELP